MTSEVLSVEAVAFEKCCVDPADACYAKFALKVVRKGGYVHQTEWFQLETNANGWRSRFDRPLAIACGPPLGTADSIKLALLCVVVDSDDAKSSSHRSPSEFVIQLGDATLAAATLHAIFGDGGVKHAPEHTYKHADSRHSGGKSVDGSSSYRIEMKGKRGNLFNVTVKCNSCPMSAVPLPKGKSKRKVKSKKKSKKVKVSGRCGEGHSSECSHATELKSCKLRLSQTEDKLLAVSTKYADLVASLKASRSSTKKKLADMCEANDDLEHTLLQMKSSWNQTASILELALKKQETELRAATVEREQFRRKSEELECDCRRQQQMVGELRKKVLVSEKVKMEFQMRATRKDLELAKYKSQLTEAQSKISKLQTVLVKVLKGSIDGFELDAGLGVTLADSPSVSLRKTSIPKTKSESPTK